MLLALSLGVILSGAGCGAKPATLPEDPGLRLMRAHELAAQAQEAQRDDEIDEAINLYRQSLEASDRFAPSWYNMGLLLQKQGRKLEAAEALQRASETDLTDPRPATALGLLAQELMHLDEAARYYSQALERNDRYLPALRKAVEVDQLRDRYDDTTLQRIRRALYLETDPQWKEFLLRQKLKAEQRIVKGSN